MNPMMFTALAASGDAASLGIQVPIVGMLMVFAVLTLLWGVLAVSRIFFYDLPKKRAAQSETDENTLTDSPAAPAAPAVAPADDAALVAAITAAITAMRADEGCTDGFRVVSFRRVDHARAWNRK